jgi:hypothetical protein
MFGGILMPIRFLWSNMISPKLLKIPFTLNVLFLLLLLISFPSLRVDSAAYYIAIFCFGVVGFSLLFFGWLLWRNTYTSKI